MWFIPAAMTFTAMVTAFLLISVDSLSPENTSLNWLVYSGNPTGARAILSTIAASIITIAGVAFSLNLVILTIASSQYGPRLLKNFIRDTGNQIVLGTFLSTFVYSLIVLLAIRDEQEPPFVPHIAVAFSFFLALASLGLLIYFINHTSSSIQAEHVITSAYEDLVKAINEFVPQQVERQEQLPIEEVISSLECEGYNLCRLTTPHSGYIQAFSHKTLWASSSEQDLVIRLLYQVGDFIVAGECIIDVYSKDELTPAVKNRILASVITGVQRTPAQEIEFPINQMTEIAIRALSPGVNDPHTAITCIHWLGSALVMLATNTLPQDIQYDTDNRLRIIRKVHDFSQLVDFCFDTIRFHAAGNVYVSIHILKSLRKVIQQAKSPAQITALVNLAEVVERSNRERVFEQKELHILTNEYEKLRADARAFEVPPDVRPQ